MGEPLIPDAAVEAAARYLYLDEREADDPDWPDASEVDARSYRRHARNILAAAYPHLAAEVIRDVAAEFVRPAEVFDSLCLQWVTDKLRCRADELERTVREEADTSTPTPEKG